MAIPLIDRSHLSEDDVTKIARNTNLTHFSTGSKARLLTDILNDKLTKQLDVMEGAINIPFLRYASGPYLEYIGEVFGLEKTPATKAEVSSEEKNFYFYTLETNFGTINNNEDIVIPAGAQLFNSPDPALRKTTYLTSEEIVLPKAENKVYFSCHSAEFGSIANIGENFLNYHDFTNYADYANDTLLVSNSSAITYGQDELTDENYRFQISKQTTVNEAANYTAIETALKSVPGIIGIKRLLYRRGVGTSDWIIKSATPTTPDALLVVAQETIDQLKADGLDHIAAAPVTIGVQMQFTITYRTRLEAKEKEQIKGTVKKNILNYINNLDIGASLILDQVLKVILNSSEKIERIGTADKNFDQIFIYKRSDLSNAKVKRILLADYKAAPYERVVAEPSVIDPIIILDRN